MDGKIKSIFEIARGMTDKELSEKYGISEDEVNAIKYMNPTIFEKGRFGDETVVKAIGDRNPVVSESLKIVVPTKEFYEDLQYLVDDFSKLKSTLTYKENITPETVAIIMDNYEEKHQRFQKRYGNVEK
jgi:hypothetical protein